MVFLMHQNTRRTALHLIIPTICKWEDPWHRQTGKFAKLHRRQGPQKLAGQAAAISIPHKHGKWLTTWNLVLVGHLHPTSTQKHYKFKNHATILVFFRIDQLPVASQVVAQEPGQTPKSPGNKFLAMHKMLHFRTCGANYQEKQLLTNSDQFPEHRSTCDHCLDLKPPQNISCACNVVAPRQLAVWCKASETLESDGLLARAFWQDMLEA